MVRCPKCGAGMERSRRKGMERVVYAHKYRCGTCDTRVSETRPYLKANLTFMFSVHTHCIRCGAPDVQRRTTMDHIDPFTRHPISRLLFLTGAPVYRCATCRVQYYDWRGKEPEQAA